MTGVQTCALPICFPVTIKNKGNVPTPNDERVKYVSIGCGKCIECTKKRARDWKVRLNEEIRVNNKAKFVTLTFDEKNLKNTKNL